MESKYQGMADELAAAAMDFLHHDADPDTYDRHVRDLAARFIPIIRRAARKATRP
jgi:hypothetical protein